MFFGCFRRQSPGLTDVEQAGLAQLTGTNHFTQAESRKVEKFLTNVLHTGDFNSRLSQQSSNGEISRDVLKKMRQFSYKASVALRTEEVATRALANLQARIRNKDALIETKLTRKQVKTLEGLAKMKGLLRELEQRGVDFQLHPDLARVAEVVRKASEWNDDFLRELERVSPQNSGDIIGYTIENDRSYLGKAMCWIIRFWHIHVLGARVTHLALGIRAKDGTNKESHMWGSPRSLHGQIRRTVGSYYNNTYRMRFENIIPAKYHNSIKENYGHLYPPEYTWEQIAQDLYHKQIHNWHDTNQELLSGLTNPAGKRLLCAVVVNALSPFSRPWRERMRFQSDWIKSGSEVSCGEFVIKASLNSLDLLGKQLSQDLDVAEEEIVKPPIRSHRRIKRYSPAKLVARGIETGGFALVPPSSFLTDLVA